MFMLICLHIFLVSLIYVYSVFTLASYPLFTLASYPFIICQFICLCLCVLCVLVEIWPRLKICFLLRSKAFPLIVLAVNICVYHTLIIKRLNCFMAIAFGFVGSLVELLLLVGVLVGVCYGSVWCAGLSS